MPCCVDLDALNAWLERQCVDLWRQVPHGTLPGTIAEAWAGEKSSLMALPQKTQGGSHDLTRSQAENQTIKAGHFSVQIPGQISAQINTRCLTPIITAQCPVRKAGPTGRLPLVAEIDAWRRQRNASGARLKWMFPKVLARNKLARVYPRTANESQSLCGGTRRSSRAAFRRGKFPPWPW